ncbi:hypothetical protein JCM6882_004233 [Rhodosporidiobolus microsporus]
MATREEVLKQIAEATKGCEALLNNDLVTARTLLSAKSDSFHLVGRGIASFLAAILSREDEELKRATETLAKAEATASAEASAKRPKGEQQVYPPGTEFKLLTGDARIGQALVAIMSESYVEFAKAIWKLNSAYKTFMATYKTVFPDGVEEDESLDSVFTKLNAHYLKSTTPSSLSIPESGGGGFFSSWGRKKGVSATQTLRHAASSSALSTSSASTISNAQHPSASEPGTTLPSAEASVENLAKDMAGKASLGEEGSYPAPLWKDDPLVTMIISGAALGSGMFGLIFSMMPPKMRKMISWFGFSNSSRPIALKLLTVAASTGNDIHGFFASLTLITFYCFVLLMSGWQAQREYLLNQCTAVLDLVYDRFPRGTLWRLNKAKLARMRRDADGAIKIIEGTLAQGSDFREADSLLVFELSWLYLSQARFIETADSFDRMNTLNSWSPSTYVAISSGALVDAHNSDPSLRAPELIDRLNKAFDHLPTLFQMKRVFGEKPVTETFIARRYEAHKAKLQRWIAAGKVEKGAKVWEVIRISNAFELGLFWATIGNRSPESGIRKHIEHLSSFTPAPRFGPSSSDPTSLPKPPSIAGLTRTSTSTSSISRHRHASSPFTPGTPGSRTFTTSDDLDSTDEVAIRDLLLGALYAALGDSASLVVAQQFLGAVLDAGAAGQIYEETWVVPFARFNLVTALCREGDVEEEKLGGGDEKKEERKKVWRGRIEASEKLLDGVFGMGEYDLKTRLESRVLMLRDELQTKKKLLGL